MNIGTIQDTDTLKVRFRGRGGAPLGEIEEGFANVEDMIPEASCSQIFSAG